MEAIPMPRPPIKRKKTNQSRLIGMAMPIDDTAKSIADKINTFLRPTLSLNFPANIAPTIQPISAHEATQPTMADERSYLFCIKPIAPATTAVSYPNKRPPTAATIVALYTYPLFISLVIFLINAIVN